MKEKKLCFLLLRESEVCRSSAPLAFKSQKLGLCILRTYALSQFGRRRMHLRCETKKGKVVNHRFPAFASDAKEKYFFSTNVNF